jgi:hypothetical protein
MPNPQQSEASQEKFIDLVKRQLIEEGKMSLGDDGYRLTELGRKTVMKELRRYETRPVMALMIEIHVLNQHEHSVW